MTTTSQHRDAEAEMAASCRGLVKKYDDVVAVDGLDLEVRRGECFGLLGPNGAGKTTTVEILEGLTPPTDGEVRVLGSSWGRGRDRKLRQRLGVQLQETHFPAKLTVEETVRLFHSFFRRGRSVGEAIAIVQLEEKRHARFEKLSGGQQQRLSLACALVGDPELLFLDEPTTGLDPQARLKIWEIVEDFRSRGGTIVLTTHYMEEATRLCDRVAIIDHGRRIALGSPNDLIASLGTDQIIELSVDHEIPAGLFEEIPGVRAVARHKDAYALTVHDVGSALSAILTRIDPSSIDRLGLHQATLEDVFVHLTGRALRDD